MKYKFNLITLLAVFFIGVFSFTNFAYADNVGLDYAKRIGSTSGGEGGISITQDGSGNTYIMMIFEGTVDFDPGDGVSNLTSQAAAGVAIVKLDSNGDFVWAKQTGGSNKNADRGNGMFVDTAGNIYITGSFTGTTDFDPGADTANLTSVGDKDVFFSKWDSNGDFVWVKQIGGTGEDWGVAIIANATNLYLTGGYDGTADFDPGAGTTNLTADVRNDIFVAKFDLDGVLVWAKSMGGPSWGDWVQSMAIDSSGNVYTTGSYGYNNTSDFDPGAGTANLTTVGDEDIFISKLDTNGNFVYAKGIGSTGWDFGWGITVDSSGNAYITGSFQGTADFDPGAGTTNLISAGSDDIFILKLDAAGDFVWVKQIGNTGGDWAREVKFDTAGNIYVTGAFAGTVDFDPNAGTYNLTSNGTYDAFILKMDTSGNLIWAKNVGGSFGAYTDSIYIDANDNVYTTGSFSETADFDPSTAVYNLVNTGTGDISTNNITDGANDVFILKLTSIVAPTLTTSTASNTTRSSTTLSGSITTTGYDVNTTRGFQYGLGTGYGSTTTETGTFSTGSYQGTISNLNCNTTYHYRAYSSNSEATGYGSDSTFTTSECPGAVPIAFLASLNKPSITTTYTPTPITQPTTPSNTVLCTGNNLFNPNTGERCTTYTNNQTNNTTTKFTFNINLKYKDNNNDVKELQKFLNNNNFPVSITGPGSLNNETTYFGPATLAAVIKYQKAKNITPSVGYFGPLTRGSVNN